MFRKFFSVISVVCLFVFPTIGFCFDLPPFIEMIGKDVKTVNKALEKYAINEKLKKTDLEQLPILNGIIKTTSITDQKSGIIFSYFFMNDKLSHIVEISNNDILRDEDFRFTHKNDGVIITTTLDPNYYSFFRKSPNMGLNVIGHTNRSISEDFTIGFINGIAKSL